MLGRVAARRLEPLLIVLATLLLAPPAWSDDDAQSKSVAKDLFDTGVRKMEEGKCDRSPIANRAACEAARDAFKRAYALYPAGLGALRNLAYVEQNLGLVASAARNFRELTRRAPLDPDPARRLWADFAKKESESLAPRIPHLTIDVPAERPPGMKLTLDGSPLQEAAWGTALEVDPGRHTVRAEAPDHAAFEQSFDLAEREEKRVSVALEKRPGAPAAADEPAPPPSTPSSPREAPPRKSRILPLVVAGAGAVTVVVGLGLGYLAIQDRKEACGDGHFCEPEQLETGRSRARASTIVTGVGGAVLAGGLVWYFLSGSSKAESTATRVMPSVVPGGASIQAIGSF
jgi:hypothetical protein